MLGRVHVKNIGEVAKYMQPGVEADLMPRGVGYAADGDIFDEQPDTLLMSAGVFNVNRTLIGERRQVSAAAAVLLSWNVFSPGEVCVDIAHNKKQPDSRFVYVSHLGYESEEIFAPEGTQKALLLAAEGLFRYVNADAQALALSDARVEQHRAEYVSAHTLTEDDNTHRASGLLAALSQTNRLPRD